MTDSSIVNQKSSIVYLVGAGPGDPKLLTLRGREVLARADVVLYDALIGDEILLLARPDAEKIFVGKRAANHALSQNEINALIVEKARAGEMVCRLKGGDPFVFGRGGEEALACRENGVPFEIVPGVSSAMAAPAYAGIPVTQRGVAASFAVVTGHVVTGNVADDDGLPAQLPRADTLVFLMGVRALGKIVARLIKDGRTPSTPVALVRWGTTANQQVVTGTLETIEAEVARANLKPPALIVVGEVVQLREQLRWFDDEEWRPLWKRNIVVTRAREQASSLVSGLEVLGARVLQCPTIAIEDLREDEYSTLDDAIENLKNFDWVVFTSMNGVEKFWARLERRCKDARALGNNLIAAIGPATRDALAAKGLSADFVPESSVSENVAAGLLALGAARVLVVRALEGREALEKTLRADGCECVVAPAYRTVPNAANAGVVREKLARGEIHWITFTSSSTVTNFIAAVGKEVLASSRASFRVACIGPTTAQTAMQNHLAPDVVAREASVESLIEAIVQVSAEAGAVR